MDYIVETRSSVFKKTLEFCQKVASSDANVLLIGESGTGKEIAANYIHQLSRRKNKDFVAVNCSAFTESLLESELFGHEQGSFTGATKSREGKIQSASGGTLFLDEIGDTSYSTQIKLLRVIETKYVDRIGSSAPRYIDFRLISATHRNLGEAIETAVFREDFFYRISTIVIRIPSLRERMEDLNFLIPFFLKRAETVHGKTIRKVTPEVNKFIYHYDYPGNIRELKNIIDRMVVLSDDGVITEDCLPIMHSMSHNDALGIPGTASRTEQSATREMESFRDIIPFREFKKNSESVYLQWVLRQTEGNVAEAARRLRMSPRQLFNKINEYQIKR